MKQMVILSGKGGAGKTSIAASLAHLAATTHAPVLVDADVDAANLELVLAPQTLEEHVFIGGQLAVIDSERCTRCGRCEAVCRFGAILALDGHFRVDPISCEGCTACATQCPVEAISLVERQSGKWYRSDTRFGPLFHASLFPGQENSGKLVTTLRQQAMLWAAEKQHDLIIIDGPPGIGCPVISASVGTDLVLLVIEPSAAGLHDAERALDAARHWGIPTVACINKADISPAQSSAVEAFCRESNLKVLGRIPFDLQVPHAMVKAMPITLYDPQATAAKAIYALWEELHSLISG